MFTLAGIPEARFEEIRAMGPRYPTFKPMHGNRLRCNQLTTAELGILTARQADVVRAKIWARKPILDNSRKPVLNIPAGFWKDEINCPHCKIKLTNFRTGTNTCWWCNGRFTIRRT